MGLVMFLSSYPKFGTAWSPPLAHLVPKVLQVHCTSLRCPPYWYRSQSPNQAFFKQALEINRSPASLDQNRLCPQSKSQKRCQNGLVNGQRKGLAFGSLGGSQSLRFAPALCPARWRRTDQAEASNIACSRAQKAAPWDAEGRVRKKRHWGYWREVVPVLRKAVL